MVRNSNIGQGGHYRLSEALKIINEQVIHPFSQAALLKAAANGELRLLCSLGIEIPLMRKEVVFCDDEPGVMATESVLVGVDCFNGFFYLDEVPNGEGNKHLAVLAGGWQSAGISAIRWREGDEEQNRSIADLQEAGLSCGDAHFWFGIDWNPEYINTGRIFPTVDDLYVFQDDLVVFVAFLKAEQNTQRGEAAVIVECSCPTPDQDLCPAVEKSQGRKSQGRKSERSGAAKDLVSAMLDAYQGKYKGALPVKLGQLLAFSEGHAIQGYGKVLKKDGLVKWDNGSVTYSAFATAFKSGRQK